MFFYSEVEERGINVNQVCSWYPDDDDLYVLAMADGSELTISAAEFEKYIKPHVLG